MIEAVVMPEPKIKNQKISAAVEKPAEEKKLDPELKIIKVKTMEADGTWTYDNFGSLRTVPKKSPKETDISENREIVVQKRKNLR